LMQVLAQVMLRVQTGQSWQQAAADTPDALRPGVQALGFAALRNWGRAQALCAELAAKPPPPLAEALLTSALALLALPEPPYAPHTLLNETVQAAKAHEETSFQAGFINACLRRFLREQAALMKLTDRLPAAQWNYPSWWLHRLQQDYPQQWRDMAAQGNQSAPLQLRVNTMQTTQADLLARLQAAGIAAQAFGAAGIELARHGDVTRLPGYAEGHFSVQDAAAQLAAPLLLLDGFAGKANLRVLDACAAPGGKTAHLLEIAGQSGQMLDLTAVELDAKRAERIGENLQRLQLTGAKVEIADVLLFAENAAAAGQQFDAVLLDAPCSASGIVRRHPDVRWLRRETDVGQLARLQAQLLRATWALLPVGGRLLYCVCSVFKAEGQKGVTAFLERNKNAALLPSPGHLSPLNRGGQTRISDNSGTGVQPASFAWIQSTAHDGFYYALLEKRELPAEPSAAAGAIVPASRGAKKTSSAPTLSPTGRPVLRAVRPDSAVTKRTGARKPRR
jgi:16S rRNA (cytosine967-C5)-methyltransferase